MIRKPKTVWKTIPCVSKLKYEAITAFLDNLNNFFSGIAKNLTEKRSEYAKKTKSPGQIDNICQLSFIIMTYETKSKILETIAPQALMLSLLIL